MLWLDGAFDHEVVPRGRVQQREAAGPEPEQPRRGALDRRPPLRLFEFVWFTVCVCVLFSCLIRCHHYLFPATAPPRRPRPAGCRSRAAPGLGTSAPERDVRCSYESGS